MTWELSPEPTGFCFGSGGGAWVDVNLLACVEASVGFALPEMRVRAPTTLGIPRNALAYGMRGAEVLPRTAADAAVLGSGSILGPQDPSHMGLWDSATGSVACSFIRVQVLRNTRAATIILLSSQGQLPAAPCWFSWLYSCDFALLIWFSLLGVGNTLCSAPGWLQRPSPCSIKTCWLN